MIEFRRMPPLPIIRSMSVAALLLLGRAFASPVAEATACGLLYLDVQPANAEISLDGRFLDTGVWLISIPPGLHALTVHKEGFHPIEKKFGIDGGQNLNFAINLEKSLLADAPPSENPAPASATDTTAGASPGTNHPLTTGTRGLQ